MRNSPVAGLVWALVAGLVGLSGGISIGGGALKRADIPGSEVGLKPLIGITRWGGAPRFYISTFEASASYASYYCRRKGQQLLSIETDRKQRDLALYMDVGGVEGSPWLSATSLGEEGVWEWGTAEPMYYNNFVDWQFSDSLSRCLTILGVDQEDKFKWARQECRQFNTFICESS